MKTHREIIVLSKGIEVDAKPSCRGPGGSVVVFGLRSKSCKFNPGSRQFLGERSSALINPSRATCPIDAKFRGIL